MPGWFVIGLIAVGVVACILLALASMRAAGQADRLSDAALKELHGRRDYNPPL